MFITTPRGISVRALDQMSLGLGLVFACLSITAFEGYGKLVFRLGLGLGGGVRVYIPIVILLNSFMQKDYK